MSEITVKSKKWYGWFWPPERRKIRLMQAIIDYKTPDIKKKADADIRDMLIYGTKPHYTSFSEYKNKS